MNGAHLKIVAIARDMLDGRQSFIEGARQITGLRYLAGLDHDPDVAIFVGIDSETDTLPFGEVRKLWMPAALEKLQPKIDDAEQWAREVGAPRCRKLIDRLRSAVVPPIKDESDFWHRLGERMTQELWMLDDVDLRWLHIEGVVPDALLPKLDEALVLVWMLVSGGKFPAEYKVTVYLDAAGIESYRNARWTDLLPDLGTSGWLTVRRELQEMDVRLGASTGS